MPFQPFVQLWIWISAFASLAGWVLSACGQLNRAGYTVAFVAFALVIFFSRQNFTPAGIKKFLPRFRRLLPLSFAALAILIFLSASLYRPDNYTGLTYRIPRVWQWLAHGQWFWIHTVNYRMNDRACGIEWLSAPLLLFTGSTRLLFLLNFLPFLLLPGLVFSVCTRLGVRPRVAWQWMWLLPTGYNFLLQAGGIANDTFPTVYALAASDFALRFRQSKNFSDLAHSILAAALLTGAKGTNLPLLLPWAVLLMNSGWSRIPRPLRLLPVVIIAAVISFLPTAILNSIYCRDWSGAVLEPPIMTVKNPLIALTGNTFQLLVENFCPPLFPQAAWWNAHAPQILPHALKTVAEHFDDGFFELGELPTEDSAGVGFGLCILLLASVLANIFIRRDLGLSGSPSAGEKWRWVILFLPWIALLAYCVKSGMIAPARLIAPYYPLLLPLLLIGVAPAQLVRHWLWQILIRLNLIFAFVVLILTPARPQWPAQTILSSLAARYPASYLLVRAENVYSLYAGRFDPLAGVRGLLPENVLIVGFAGGQDDAEISLWLPPGSRRVEDFLLTDSMAQIQQRGIEYAVIGNLQLEQFGITIDDWLKKSGAQLLASTHVTLKISTGEETFYVVQFKPAPLLKTAAKTRISVFV